MRAPENFLLALSSNHGSYHCRSLYTSSSTNIKSTSSSIHTTILFSLYFCNSPHLIQQNNGGGCIDAQNSRITTSSTNQLVSLPLYLPHHFMPFSPSPSLSSFESSNFPPRESVKEKKPPSPVTMMTRVHLAGVTRSPFRRLVRGAENFSATLYKTTSETYPFSILFLDRNSLYFPYIDKSGRCS